MPVFPTKIVFFLPSPCAQRLNGGRLNREKETLTNSPATETTMLLRRSLLSFRQRRRGEQKKSAAITADRDNQYSMLRYSSLRRLGPVLSMGGLAVIFLWFNSRMLPSIRRNHEEGEVSFVTDHHSRRRILPTEFAAAENGSYSTDPRPKKTVQRRSTYNSTDGGESSALNMAGEDHDEYRTGNRDNEEARKKEEIRLIWLMSFPNSVRRSVLC